MRKFGKVREAQCRKAQAELNKLENSEAYQRGGSGSLYKKEWTDLMADQVEALGVFWGNLRGAWIHYSRTFRHRST